MTATMASARRSTDQPRAVREATDLARTERHYVTTHPHLNPARILPIGPATDWEEPTSR